MYQERLELSGPQAVGYPPFLDQDHDKVDHFYYMVEKYKVWLLGCADGFEELMSDIDIGTLFCAIEPMIKHCEDYNTGALKILAKNAEILGQDLHRYAEKLADKWARARIDESYANRLDPDYTHPWDDLPR